MTTRESSTGAPGSIVSGNPVEPAKTRERTPWLLAFLCLLIGVLPSNSVIAGPLKSNGSPGLILPIVLFALSLLGFGLIRRTGDGRALRPGLVLILLYFLLTLVVAGVGFRHVDSAAVEASKIRTIIGLVATVGLALYAMTRVETTRQRTIVLGFLATGLTFACVVAVLQNSLKLDLSLLLQPPGFVVNTGDQGRGAGGGGIGEARFGSSRAAGTALHPIELSVMAAVAVPLTIHFARYSTNRRVRWLAWLACGVGLLALPAAVSRSGVLALAAALLVYMWAFNVRQIASAIVTAAAVILVQFAIFPNNLLALWQTIVNASNDPSITDRTSDFIRVSQTFHEFPTFGIGLGAALPSEYGFLDNQWLHAVVEGGLVGLTAMILLAGGGIFGISAALRCAATPRERDQAYMMGAMFVAILVSGFTFDLFSFPQAASIFFILFGLLWSKFTVWIPEKKIARLAEHNGGG